MKCLDLTNKKFGRLLVLSKVNTVKHSVMWECLCDCGKHTIVAANNLTSGRIKSCGCLKIDRLIERSTTHNQRHTKLYDVWKTMRQRCDNPNNVSYHNYGGRGISVCEDWKTSFQSFYDWSMQNGYSEKLTIDRIDVNGNYCPENCRWTDRTTQANNMRCNRLIEYNGEIYTLANLARKYNLSYSCLQNRLSSNWSIEKAISVPPRKSRKQ